MSRRCRGVAPTRSPLNGCAAAGMKRSRSSASASKASEAASKWPMCGGSKVPPSTPSRTRQRGGVCAVAGGLPHTSRTSAEPG